MKSLLLACTILLGLQFCFPVTSLAQENPVVAELINVGLKDPVGESDASSDLDLFDAFLLALGMGQRSLDDVLKCMDPDGVVRTALLPATGLHPSAP